MELEIRRFGKDSRVIAQSSIPDLVDVLKAVGKTEEAAKLTTTLHPPEADFVEVAPNWH